MFNLLYQFSTVDEQKPCKKTGKPSGSGAKHTLAAAIYTAQDREPTFPGNGPVPFLEWRYCRGDFWLPQAFFREVTLSFPRWVARTPPSFDHSLALSPNEI
jgi:hypothetical protein